MGLGKTASSLTVAVDRLNAMMVNHVLVVGPKPVALNVWPAEIESWEHTRSLSYTVLSGLSAAKRAKAAKTLPEVTIINFELLPWLIDFWGVDWPYDMLIVDEISQFKAPSKKTKPTKKKVEEVVKAVYAKYPNATPEHQEKLVKMELRKIKRGHTRFGALASVRERVKYVLGLTGTICPTGLLGLWSQYFIVDNGARLGTSFYDYRNTYFVSDYMGYNWEPRPDSFRRITEAVADITVSMRTEDYVDLPPVLYNQIKVDLPPDARKAYDALERDLLLDMDDEGFVEALNAGVLVHKLLQVCNGAVYVQDGPADAHGEYSELHSAKLEALDGVLHESNGAPVLVVYSFQHDLERLKKRYPRAEVAGEKPDLQKRWNNGEIPILLAHPGSVGHGLNLQFGGSVLVWFGLTWSLELYQQTNKRLHRPGQKETVVIHHIVAKDTVDERVMAVLPRKAELQDAFVEATLMRV